MATCSVIKCASRLLWIHPIHFQQIVMMGWIIPAERAFIYVWIMPYNAKEGMSGENNLKRMWTQKNDHDCDVACFFVLSYHVNNHPLSWRKRNVATLIRFRCLRRSSRYNSGFQQLVNKEYILIVNKAKPNRRKKLAFLFYYTRENGNSFRLNLFRDIVQNMTLADAVDVVMSAVPKRPH